MFSDNNAAVTIAVKDTNAARRFYEGVLGLKQVPTREEGVLNYKSGNSSIFVYESRYAGTNKATAATWVVKDVEGAVADLKGKGVTFEHYDVPQMTRKGDVHVSGETHAAWFKDPDGNILSLVNG
jgi:catechol 2,3-dioxygenase-like lactoylglutathione lyase family enzyme